MNSFKTVIVVSVMAVVAYGVYASLTRGPVDQATDSDAGPAVELPADDGASAQSPVESGFSPKYTGNAAKSKSASRHNDEKEISEAEATEKEPKHESRSRATGRRGRSGERYSQSSRTYPDTGAAEGNDSPDGGYAVAESDDSQSAPEEQNALNPENEGNPPEAEAPLPDLPDFAQAMQDIQAKLDRNQLTVAHRELTRWYDVLDLPTADRQQVESLLDQLAGTIIYSPDGHYLGPAYVVRDGDTLIKIAETYDVPWQLLAKINGIDDPQHVQPGQQLKVLRGPFDAVLDLGAFRLTLLLDGCYAGRFAIGIGQDHPTPEGNFAVQMKVENPDYYGPAGVIRADDPNNPLGRYWIHLSDNQHGTDVSLHGTNDPASVGPRDGLGSIRLRPEDIEDVYDILSVGSRIVIRR